MTTAQTITRSEDLHDGRESLSDFGAYSIRAISGHSRFCEDYRARIVADLACGMPEFDVAEYFGNQPGVFADYDFVTIAHEGGDGPAIGLIGARWLEAGGRRLLYLWTAMLADAYRSTRLYARLKVQTMAAVRQANGGALPGLIATKTYNPRVLALLHKYFAGSLGAAVYPMIPGPQAGEMRGLAAEVAYALWPAMAFDADTAVLRGGQAAVSPNFFPRMESCADPAINAHFARRLTRSDQILCIIRLPGAGNAA